MVSYVICTFTTVPFLLLRTPYIVERAVIHDITRTKRERGSAPDEEVTQVKHNDQLPLRPSQPILRPDFVGII